VTAAIATGDYHMARDIQIRQRRDRVRRSHLTPAERIWSSILRVTVGYGFRPSLALGWLLATALLGITLTLGLGHEGMGAPQQTNETTPISGPDQSSLPCGRLQLIGVAIDNTVPLVGTDASEKCVPLETTRGAILTVAGWVLQLFGWVFATLFVAGFTGIIRRQ